MRTICRWLMIFTFSVYTIDFIYLNVFNKSNYTHKIIYPCCSIVLSWGLVILIFRTLNTINQYLSQNPTSSVCNLYYY